MRGIGMVATAVACAGLYLLFAGQISAHEIIVGVVLGVGAAGYAGAQSRAADRRFAIGASEGRQMAGAFLRAPWAATRVGAGFARETIGLGAQSSVRRTHFRPGRDDDPRDRARRAVCVLARSLAPDAFVFRADPQESDLREHVLISKGEERR